MAFIGLKVPPETGRLLNELDVPGTKEPLHKYHITMMYIGDEVPFEDLLKAIEATYNVTSQSLPFSVRTNKISHFPNGDEVPIICPIESPAIHILREKLVKSFDAAGVDFNKKHPNFTPHVTLAFDDKVPGKDRNINSLEWGAHELVLWGGDSGDDRLVVSFPFSMTSTQKVARRYLGKS